MKFLKNTMEGIVFVVMGRAKLNQRAWLRELKRTQGALDFGSEFQPGVLKIKGPEG